MKYSDLMDRIGSENDSETNAAIEIQKNEITRDMKFDTMAVIGYLQAAQIILDSQESLKTSFSEIIQLSRFLAELDRGSI